MIVVVDNYDSFTYNLVQMISPFADVVVARNDAPELSRLLRLADGIVVSPGPGRPESTGLLPELLGEMLSRKPVLGVCLGHQLLGLLAGCEVRRHAPVHGKTSRIRHDGIGIFQGIAQDFAATRYHSLAIAGETVRPPWRISATGDDGTVMAIRSPDGMAEGVQFHPESIATLEGPRLMQNFLGRCGG